MYAVNQAWLHGSVEMVTILRGVVGFGHRATSPRPTPLAKLTMKNEVHGFLFLCIHMGLFL